MHRRNYSHIVFDIDGTLLDSEYAVLQSMQDALFELGHGRPELHELSFALGVPGEITLKQMGIENPAAANHLWNEIFRKYYPTIDLFKGIRKLIIDLKSGGYSLGVVTSKNRNEYSQTFSPYGLDQYFDTIICVDDCESPKPSPAPLHKYMELSGAQSDEVLYIGDTIYDMQCASGAGVDFGLALWGCHSAKHIYATHYFSTPNDVAYTLSSKPNERASWLKWGMELQFIAQAGMTYSTDPFDRERFARIREMSAEIMSMGTAQPIDFVRNVFCNETGFQTPKIDSRAAIFNNGKILLIQERNGEWALPGGWVDVNESVKSNTVKEAKEEAGLDVAAVRVIALQDRNLHNTPVYAYGIMKVFVLCEIVGGSFETNIETQKSAFFGLNELPPLALDRTTEAQIKMCFDANLDKNWITVFD